MPDVPVSVFIDWNRQEPTFKSHLEAMSASSLLKFAKCLWWDAIQRGEPFSYPDQRQLACAREECARRKAADQFDALEGEMRNELWGRGLLPGQRELARRQAG